MKSYEKTFVENRRCVVGWVLVSQLAGVIGSFATVGAVREWYPTLVRPFLNPPSWVFGPVWTLLFVLMGTAAFLVWRAKGTTRAGRFALKVFLVQLVFNALWSILFFGLQSPELAVVCIGILWSLILWCIILFFKHSRTAGYLMIPYLLWVTFATYLNVSIAILN